MVKAVVYGPHNYMKREIAWLVLCSLAALGLACRPSTTSRTVNLEACSLLAASEIEATQGEAVAETQPTDRTGNGLASSQCFYRLPTFNRSISLEVMHPVAGSSSAATTEFWQQRFHSGMDAEAEERAAERREELKRAGGQAPTDEADKAGPQPIPGIGDEAFWSGTQINGSLYVLKDDVIIRLSLGGPEDPAAKIQKAAALTGQVLSRL